MAAKKSEDNVTNKAEMLSKIDELDKEIVKSKLMLVASKLKDVKIISKLRKQKARILTKLSSGI